MDRAPPSGGSQLTGYRLGVDLGTTYTAAAIERDGRVEVCTLGDRTATIPTLVLVRPGGELLVGEAAQRRALSEPTNIAREFKRRLGDPAPLVLGGTAMQPEVLMAAVLRQVVQLVSVREGRGPDRVVLTHPANFGPYKLDLMRAVARLADVVDVVLLPEPHAAAISYAQRSIIEPGRTVAVYDFGGGTFDAALVRRTASGGFEIVGQPEGMDRLGGIDLDQALVDHVLDATGLGEQLGETADAATLAGLVDLRERCQAAKEALSSDSDALVPVSIAGTATTVRITRALFESIARPRVLETIEALQRAIRNSGLGTDDIDRVLLVGGSSRIPIVADTIRATIGRPVALDANPKTAICEGAVLSLAVAPPPAAAFAEPAGAGVPVRPPSAPTPTATPLAPPSIAIPPTAPPAPPRSPAPPVPAGSPAAEPTRPIAAPAGPAPISPPPATAAEPRRRRGKVLAMAASAAVIVAVVVAILLTRGGSGSSADPTTPNTAAAGGEVTTPARAASGATTIAIDPVPTAPPPVPATTPIVAPTTEAPTTAAAARSPLALAVGKTVWYGGFELTFDTATMPAAADAPAGSGVLTLQGAASNLTDKALNIGFLGEPGPITVQSGGSSAPVDIDAADVSPNASVRFEMRAVVTGFDPADAVVDFGGPELNNARLPLTAGDVTAVKPVTQSLSGAATTSTGLTMALTSAVIAPFNPVAQPTGVAAQAPAGQLYVRIDVHNSYDGDIDDNVIDPVLLRPDGVAASATDVQNALIATGASADDVYVFPITTTVDGNYTLRFGDAHGATPTEIAFKLG